MVPLRLLTGHMLVAQVNLSASTSETTVENEMYSITQVAASFDLSVAALRYYEERGLLRPACRRARVRYYDRAALRSLALLLLWHRDGMMSLDDTATLMSLPDRAQWRSTVAHRANALGRHIKRLQEAKAALDHFLDCTSDHPATCPVLEEMLNLRVKQAMRPSQAAPPDAE
jgi:DNA-binding transcriptional MerR regulator